MAGPTYTCRGARIGFPGGTVTYRGPEPDFILLESEEFPAMTAEEAQARIVELVRGGDTEKALARTLDDLCRQPCGQVLNEVIETAPADGKEQTAVCPHCGNPFRFTNTPPSSEG